MTPDHCFVSKDCVVLKGPGVFPETALREAPSHVFFWWVLANFAQTCVAQSWAKTLGLLHHYRRNAPRASRKALEQCYHPICDEVHKSPAED